MCRYRNQVYMQEKQATEENVQMKEKVIYRFVFLSFFCLHTENLNGNEWGSESALIICELLFSFRKKLHTELFITALYFCLYNYLCVWIKYEQLQGE